MPCWHKASCKAQASQLCAESRNSGPSSSKADNLKRAPDNIFNIEHIVRVLAISRSGITLSSNRSDNFTAIFLNNNH
jgi:hypothetical protein